MQGLEEEGEAHSSPPQASQCSSPACRATCESPVSPGYTEWHSHILQKELESGLGVEH